MKVRHHVLQGLGGVDEDAGRGVGGRRGDRRGGRLGQGKGYYDRALARLDASGDVLVVGVAFEVQVLPAVPTETFDRRLDAVLTEREWIALSR